MQKNKAAYPEIEHRSDMQSYPLSFQQERVLYLNRLSADGPLWNRISCKRLIGNVNASALRDALKALIEKHSALRTRLSVSSGVPSQSKHAFLENAFELIDLTSTPSQEAEMQARTIVNQQYSEPFVLEGGPLFKMALVRCSGTESWVILKLHHIISDATSLRILWRDLKAGYKAKVHGDETSLNPELEYFDYAAWVREQFTENKTRRQESYWISRFAANPPELDLPTDAPRPERLTFAGAIEKQGLPQELTKRLGSFALGRKVIPFSVLLSATYLLLRAYSGQEDLVIGTVFSGRHCSPKVRQVVGFFSNTVALRARLEHVHTVDEFVQLVHKLVTDAHEMQDYPFERLVSRLDPDRKLERNPVFRAMFNMVTGEDDGPLFEGVEREEWIEPNISATQVDFFLDIHMMSDTTEVRIEYNADIFSKATIGRMLRHYVAIVEKVIEEPGTSIRDLDMLDEAERTLILSFGKGPSQTVAPTTSIIGLLEERAALTPNQTALLFDGGEMTCAQLNERANRLAASIVGAGVCKGDVVAIMVERSPEMVIGLFAILKAGAAYLPIDPTFPPQRIEYMLADSGVSCILMQKCTNPNLSKNNTRTSVTCIAVDQDASYIGSGKNKSSKPDPSTPAYVIYTSGSTGMPKGVVVQHSALMNTLQFLEDKYAQPEKTILLKTNYTFDVSAAELFGWLFDGGRLAVLERGAERDPKRLLRAIDQFRVTHVNFVPSMLDAFMSTLHELGMLKLGQLKYVFAAGEALMPDVVKRFYQFTSGVRLENLYGPTEAAIYATEYSVPRGKELHRVPIGKPLANTRAYIVDGNMKLVPVGLTGELCLSGAGLARGYLRQPNLTDTRFCQNPYWEGQRMYKTGDVARWTDDGLIEFLGRADGQVKIRGFRIELGEVEQRLLACSGVLEAVVTLRTDKFGQKGLVGYVACKQGRQLTADEIHVDMSAWLPPYMIPENIVFVDQLPRLPSGKVNIPALPESLCAKANLAEARPVASQSEQTIIKIAEGLLNTSGLGPNSNFFRLGGNSLLTLRFIAALDGALGTHLSVIDFLGLPTIAEIATLIEKSPREAHRSADADAMAGRSPECRKAMETQ